jgi:hypothetical protein
VIRDFTTKKCAASPDVGTLIMLNTRRNIAEVGEIGWALKNGSGGRNLIYGKIMKNCERLFRKIIEKKRTEMSQT